MDGSCGPGRKSRPGSPRKSRPRKPQEVAYQEVLSREASTQEDLSQEASGSLLPRSLRVSRPKKPRGVSSQEVSGSCAPDASGSADPRSLAPGSLALESLGPGRLVLGGSGKPIGVAYQEGFENRPRKGLEGEVKCHGPRSGSGGRGRDRRRQEGG